MNFFRKQWEAFKRKSVWGKLGDILFIVLLTVLISSDGRIFLQRMVLETGLFGSFYENEDEPITEANWKLPLIDLEGNSIVLGDLKGQTIFLNFWATWCPPCNAEIPSMIRLMESCQDANVAFVLVTTEPSEKVRPFMEKKGWDIPVYRTTMMPAMELNYSSIPTTFIINESGVLVHASSGARKWDDEDVRSFFGCADQ